MYYKLFTFLLVVCLLSAAGINSQNRVKHIKIVQNGDVLRGDTGPLVYGPPAPVNIYSSPVMAPVTFTDNSSAIMVTLSEVNVEMRSAYDLQSNCIIKFLWQDAANPNNMHAIMMASTDPGPSYTDRNVRYAYSTNRGVTWDYLGTVTASRSGFPSIVQKNDGSAIVLAHANDGGGLTRTQLWVDVAPGAATWTMFDPGTNGNTSTGAIWPSAAIDLSNNKVLWASSQNGVDSCLGNVATGLTTPPGTFRGYFPVPDGETAGAYAPAVGTTKYGIAFNTLTGGAAIIESNDQGVTWGAPTVILNWNPADSLGTIRSIDMTYKGDMPRVVIGLARVDPIGGTFVPGLPSRIVFWGPDVNGGTPVLVDSSQGLVGSNPTNDVFLSSTRAVIGKSADGNALYCAWNRISGDTSAMGNDIFDVWFAYSIDNGATWTGKTKVTNNSGPLLDCRYVGISPTNALVGPNHHAYLVYQADSIAGSNVNGAPPSIAKLMFAKIDLTGEPIGISSTSTEVPARYELSQNYPNPFNPQTKIKFALPKSGLVTLKLYDVVGREVAVLINQQVTAGSFEYVLNANNLPSGVYFYKLIANDFVDSKKMILVK